MILLDGKKVSNEIINNIKIEISSLERKIGFAIIWVGDNEASSIYVRNKLKKCEELGIDGKLFHLEENATEEDVINLIEKLNTDKNINGILLQSPVPNGINIINCFNKINPAKDIDGFSCISVGNLWLGNPYHISCTPKGIIRLLDAYNIDLNGKSVCLINRSNIVGKPLFNLLINRNATVTMCHSKTVDIKDYTRNADIVISAVGKPNFITSDMVKDGVIIIDVGINRVDGKVKGDVDFESVSKKASYITPVPGGVGPMTIAMIFENILNVMKEEEKYGQILNRSTQFGEKETK